MHGSCTASPWAMDHLLHTKPHSCDHLKLRDQDQRQASAKAVILKIKHLLHGFILKHAGRLAVALGGARSALLDLLDTKTGLVARHGTRLRRKTKNWKGQEPCGGGGGGGSTPLQHLSLLPDGAVPPSSEETGGGVAYYYDSSWNAVIPAEQLPPMIAGYLEWAEEDGTGEEEKEGGCNEIDRLAEKFIARCRERFVLEKQESYRRFQEMLARSL